MSHLSRDTLCLPLLPSRVFSRVAYVAVCCAIITGNNALFPFSKGNIPFLTGVVTCVSDVERLLGKNWPDKLGVTHTESRVREIFSDRTATKLHRWGLEDF